MVYAKFGGQTECIMGNSKIENTTSYGEASWNSTGNIISRRRNSWLIPCKGIRIPESGKFLFVK